MKRGILPRISMASLPASRLSSVQRSARAHCGDSRGACGLPRGLGIVAVGFALVVHCATFSEAHANPGFGSNVGLKASVRSQVLEGPFVVPEKLRGRVDFWRDIFTKYGRAHSVIHHRDFPQIIFGVVDLSREYEVMSPVAFQAYHESTVKKTVSDMKRQLLELSSGRDAETPFQQKAIELMRDLPGGPAKFKRLVDEDLVRSQTGIRERYAEAIRRSWRYLPIMEQIFVSEYGLPKELTRIPFIESSFDYTAYSSVGAAGIWQFMPRTARAHRMTVGRVVDERRDPIKATRAAAEYLRSAYNSLGAWPLAITSYNHGVGGVRSKVRKAGTQDLATIIEDPNERYFGFASTNFYPEFLAALEIFNDHQRYFPEVKEEPPLRVVSYPVRGSMSAGYAAQSLGLSTEELKEANYALLESVWKGKARIPAGYVLRVPAHAKERGDSLFGGGGVIQRASDAPASAQAPLQASYTVKRGETLDSIARKVGLSESELMRINRLSSSRVASGQRLRLIDDERGASTTSGGGGVKADKSTDAPRGDFYIVRRGDSLATIAKRHNVSMDQLKRTNNLKGSGIKAGQKLRIPRS